MLRSSERLRRIPRMMASLAMVAAVCSHRAAAQDHRPDFHARFLALAAQRGLSDSTRLHRLFALDWEYTNVESPESASFVGFPGQEDRWTDYSVQAIARRTRELPDRHVVLRAIDRRRLAPSDQLSYDVFARGVDESIEGARFPSDFLAVTQLAGPQYLSSVINAMPATSVRDYEHVLARLAGIARVIDQTLVLLDSGLARGVTPPRVTLRDVPVQLERLAPDSAMASALLAPFTAFPAAIPAAERQRLTTEATRVYTTSVRPAYRRLGEYLQRTYIPKARETIALSALPDGRAWYAYNVKLQTTTSRTPAEIHRLGLSEVARIRAQMDSVIRATGFGGDFAAFVAMLRTDKRFYVDDSATLVRGYRDIAKRIDPELSRLFGKLPRLTYGVTTVPSYSAPSQTTAYYLSGSPDAHRPGQFFVNTYKLDSRPTWEMEALTAHEAVPGHHLQIALSQELGELPEFRRYAGYTAFTEGWGLYAESLGPELGLYRDPYSRFGQLSYEMWRAIRLVLDTGIHDRDWSREQAIEYFRANSSKTDQDIQVEVDRYIVRPGQALAYKSGELEIKDLRARAERALGDRFDIRAFHDEVLSQGAIPLDILDARLTRWIAERSAIRR
jgi:uncharacterized protein (DUF885 family)